MGCHVTCRTFIESIGEYLSNDLRCDSRRAFDRHEGWCRDCRRYRADYEAAISFAAGAFAKDEDIDPDPIPEELVTAILAARLRP